MSATPHYSRIRHPDGRESTVSTRDLAPSPRDRVPSIEAHTPIPSSNTSATPILQPGTDSSLIDSQASHPEDSVTPSPGVKVHIQLTPGHRSTGPDAEDQGPYL